jgi:hypothetical protein
VRQQQRRRAFRGKTLGAPHGVGVGQRSAETACELRFVDVCKQLGRRGKQLHAAGKLVLHKRPRQLQLLR